MLLSLSIIVEPRRMDKHLRYATVYVRDNDELQVQRYDMRPHWHPK